MRYSREVRRAAMPSWIGLEEPSDSDEDRAYTEHVREVNKKRDAYLQREKQRKAKKAKIVGRDQITEDGPSETFTNDTSELKKNDDFTFSSDTATPGFSESAISYFRPNSP